ncbi:MAG: family 20 glycosylhydrolase [Phycisphaerae bacterium]|nr:family 20 glycosylhydrolase [Phycisphaerae bacterium]
MRKTPFVPAVAIACCLALPRPSLCESNPPQWRGVHVMAWGPAGGPKAIPPLKRAIKEVLVPLGVNVIVYEVDYNFAFDSHPELRYPDVITKPQARDLATFCREHSIRLIPQFNCLGHQSWARQDVVFPLMVKYPELEEVPDLPQARAKKTLKSWCPLHPKINEIVFPLIDEIADAFQADAFHVGMDEVLVIASNKCPRCRGKDPAELFAKAVSDLHRHIVKEKGLTMLMWGDRLLDAGKKSMGNGWEASNLGTARAIDLVPKDIIICDWHYSLQDDYPSVRHFQQKGFRVLTSSWKNAKAAEALIDSAARSTSGRWLGHLCTSWVLTPGTFAEALLGEGDPAKIKDRAAPAAAAVKACMKKLSENADPMTHRYAGKEATTRDDLQPYTGKNAWKAVVGDHRQSAYRLNYDQLHANYGDAVEFQLRAQQVILCPQTAEFLYTRFTPTTVRYRKGARPELENVVAKATAGCATDKDKALALMRYCRDLYDEKWYTSEFKNYVYGGTEEQLIAKGEILCECLGRLLVALCEVAGLPGRIVMHDIGGHIAAEILVAGKWAYIDPRCGIYFLLPDGSLASLWDLWHDPELIDRQSDAVKADAARWWTWRERAYKCKTRYFHPNEINGFQNYSLADADKYSYAQRPAKQAADAGLWEINKEYLAEIFTVFGLAGDGLRRDWRHNQLRRIPIAYRHDGFSLFFNPKPPMTREFLQQRYVDPFKNTNATILVWGLGPGSVFCYDTKIGQVFGAPLNDQQWKLMREGDRNVFENVTGLIKAGDCPLKVAVRRGHELGLKVLARLEMNHEYGPAKDDNWLWVGLVGDLNKQHPEYRIPGRVLLDFKHKPVRDFKLAILREAVEAGADGVSLDFAVYPPFFEKPDQATMTQFVRDLRAALDDVGRRQNRPIEIMARLPHRGSPELGLDWKTWMIERLIDIIVPTHYRPNEVFDVDVDEFISMRNKTGVKVFPTVWQALGFVTTDPQPGDKAKGIRRYDKPKTKEIYFAQAMLFHRADADGLQLGFSQDQWVTHPWLNDLADPAKVEFADKQYMVDPKPHCPVTFDLPTTPPYRAEKTVSLRIGDDVAKAKRQGHEVKAKIIIYARPLQEGERLAFHVNGHDPVEIRGQSPPPTSAQVAVNVHRTRHGDFLFDKDWWKRGMSQTPIEADWLRLGTNEIRLVYTAPTKDVAPPLSITWIDLVLDFERAP